MNVTVVIRSLYGFAINSQGWWSGYGWWQECNCRKGHPTPSPENVTAFCEHCVCYGNCPIARNLSCILHGVCYGFETLQKHEPQRLFQFPPGLKLIIYDNAFHLHVYSQNRESQFQWIGSTGEDMLAILQWQENQSHQFPSQWASKLQSPENPWGPTWDTRTSSHTVRSSIAFRNKNKHLYT